MAELGLEARSSFWERSKLGVLSQIIRYTPPESLLQHFHCENKTDTVLALGAYPKAQTNNVCEQTPSEQIKSHGILPGIPDLPSPTCLKKQIPLLPLGLQEAFPKHR